MQLWIVRWFKEGPSEDLTCETKKPARCAKTQDKECFRQREKHVKKWHKKARRADENERMNWNTGRKVHIIYTASYLVSKYNRKPLKDFK